MCEANSHYGIIDGQDEFEDALTSDYECELMKCRKLEKTYITTNQKRLEAKINPLLSIEEIQIAINENNLAKQAWEMQERIVKFTLHKDEKYHKAYTAFKAYIDTKILEEHYIAESNSIVYKENEYKENEYKENEYKENISPFVFRHKL
jgi:hypothetical protein